MSRRLVVVCAGAVLGLGLAMSGKRHSQSYPLEGATNGAETLVDQVHGRHRYCARWPGRGGGIAVGRGYRPLPAARGRSEIQAPFPQRR